MLRSAIGSYKNNHKSDSVGHLSSIAYRLPDLFYFFGHFKPESAVTSTTFDILRNFTRIPVENLHSQLVIRLMA